MKEKVGKIFSYPTLVQESDLDSFGHLNNAVYLRMFEEARWDFISPNGFSLEEIQERGLGPVVLEIQIRFEKELKARQKITIHSQALNYSKKVGQLKQWMVNEKGESCCEAVFTVGFWDIRKRKLVPATEDWLKAVGL